MPAGRPPKSDAEKKRKNTFRPSRSTGDEIAPPRDPKAKGRKPNIQKPPNTATTEGQRLFSSIVQLMTVYKTITEADYHSITILVSEYDRYLTHRDFPPVEINADTGLSVVSAYHKIAKDSLANFLKFATALNITPAMRARIRIIDDKPEDTDPIALLLKGARL